MNRKKIKISIKDIIYILIIFFLIVLIMLLKKDIEINIFDKDNWIDIIIGSLTILSSTILSLLIIIQGYKLNDKSEKIEIELFNKQVDLDLRERRLNIYSSFMSIGDANIINNENYIITNFINGNHQKNETRFNEIVAKEKELVIALCESEIMFKNHEELLKKIRNLFNAFVEYKRELQNYFDKLYIANKKAIKMLNNDGINITMHNIPKEIITKIPNEYIKCKEIFCKYYNDVRTKENTLIKLITDKTLRSLFDKAININKIGGAYETKI